MVVNGVQHLSQLLWHLCDNTFCKIKLLLREILLLIKKIHSPVFEPLH